MLAFFNSLPGAVAQGIIWGIMAIGVYITFRTLDIADLTVDGSFATGGAVLVMCTINGINIYVAMLLAFLAGCLAGFVTGILHTQFGIPAILSGILTQIALYSINLRILGNKANQPLSVMKYDILVSLRYLSKSILICSVFAVLLIAILYWFFGTEMGMSLRATGCNQNMARANGINTNANKIIGLTISNGIVALSGALLSQYQGFADINMGRGAIVIGLAAVIIGEVIFGKIFKNFALRLLAVVFGGIVYYIVITFVLMLGLNANDLKLFTAIIVALFLGVPYWKSKIKEKTVKTVREVNKMLKLENIYKTFNPGTINEKKALNGLNIQLDEGDFVTVIGGNGAGKSTMLNMIAGVYPVDSGSVIIDGTDVTKMPEHKRAKFLGRVFQDPMMGTAADMEIVENLALANRRGKARTIKWGVNKKETAHYKEILASLELGLEERLTSKVGLLSGGQRQALTLLMATLKKPKVLLLDEHTAALDPKTAKKVLDITQKIVAENNLTTIMITHNMKDAIRIGNRLIMMNNGKIIYDVSGEEKKNLTTAQLLEKFKTSSGEELDNDRMLLAED